MNFLMKKLAAMNTANKAALETNRAVLKTAEQDTETVENIRSHAERQAHKLRLADRRNHYSESLTESFQGRTA